MPGQLQVFQRHSWLRRTAEDDRPRGGRAEIFEDEAQTEVTAGDRKAGQNVQFAWEASSRDSWAISRFSDWSSGHGQLSEKRRVQRPFVPWVLTEKVQLRCKRDIEEFQKPQSEGLQFGWVAKNFLFQDRPVDRAKQMSAVPHRVAEARKLEEDRGPEQKNFPNVIQEKFCLSEHEFAKFLRAKSYALQQGA